jgi:hypothetical protein
MTSANGGKPGYESFEQLTPGEEERTIPLVGGVARPEGLPQAAQIGQGKTSKSLNQGTLLLIAVCLIGAASLYIMRLGGNTDTKPSPKAKEAEVMIDQALDKMGKKDTTSPSDPLNKSAIDSLFKDANEVLSLFTLDPTQLQVPVEYVKKNPFFLPLFKPQDQMVAIPSSPTDPDAANQAMLRRLQMEVSDLDLQSVITGARPVAIINGQLLQPGQTIGNFTVKSIQPTGVELQSNGQVFRLDIKSRATEEFEGAGAPGKRAPGRATPTQAGGRSAGGTGTQR